MGSGAPAALRRDGPVRGWGTVLLAPQRRQEQEGGSDTTSELLLGALTATPTEPERWAPAL